VTIEAPPLRRCPACKEEKPATPEFFQLFTRASGNGKRMGYCRPCQSARARTWQKANPAYRKAQSKRYNVRKRARAQAFKALVEPTGSVDPKTLDALRKALVEQPPALAGEKQMLAYFRGFMDGAKHREAETARFEECKDLVYRIAREKAKSAPQAYEHYVSAGFEGLLDALRRANSHIGPLRPYAAVRIRGAIGDHQRAYAKAKAFDGIPLEHILAPFEDEVVESLIEAKPPVPEADPDRDDPEVLSILDKIGLEGRKRLVVLYLARGMTLREAGEKAGISESRVCQIVAGVRKEHGEKLRRVLGVE
jgi:RNA polymerase sigma factor (sigma-70 family)